MRHSQTLHGLGEIQDLSGVTGGRGGVIFIYSARPVHHVECHLWPRVRTWVLKPDLSLWLHQAGGGHHLLVCTGLGKAGH